VTTVIAICKECGKRFTYNSVFPVVIKDRCFVCEVINGKEDAGEPTKKDASRTCKIVWDGKPSL